MSFEQSISSQALVAIAIHHIIFDLDSLVDTHHRELQADRFINRLKAEGCYTITPLMKRSLLVFGIKISTLPEMKRIFRFMC